MARSLAQHAPGDVVGSVAWVLDDARPLVAPSVGVWVEIADYDNPTSGDVFSSACPIRYAPSFDVERYNVVQVNPDDGSAWWLYNTQGQVVSYDDGSGRAHWMNTLPTGTPNVFPPPTNWRKYETDGEGRALWVQPSGAFDAYPQGFRVVHDPPSLPSQARVFESLVAANVWEPGTSDTLWSDLGKA